MCCLQSLGLGGNEIHNEGAAHLALALRVNRRLRSLGLGGNQIGMASNPVFQTDSIMSVFLQLMREEEL